MAFMSIEEQNIDKKNSNVTPPRIVKEWSYADSKDLSMNLGGILHDVTPLVAAGVDPTPENVAKFRKWAEKIYELKVEIQNNIKKQS